MIWSERSSLGRSLLLIPGFTQLAQRSLTDQQSTQTGVKSGKLEPERFAP